MLTFRQLSPRSFTISLRAFTVSSASTPESSVPPPPKTLTNAASIVTPTTAKGQPRRKFIPPKRPAISLESPRTWNRPLKQGVVPAYDLALKALTKDSLLLKAEAKQMRRDISKKEANYRELKAKLENEESVEERNSLNEEMRTLDEELEKMLEKLHIVQVQSEVNLPDVRWKVNNAMADMSNLSHRHLIEQKWRKDGALDLLMERIYQMKVVPDVLPEINPTIDLQVIARTLPAEFLKTKKVFKAVEPGIYLRPKQTLQHPKLHTRVFHADERLYTMLLVDLDVPNPVTGSFTTFLHWLKPNISLSALSPSRIPDPNTHTRYIPPHPQRGSPYHRYVCLLLQQPPLVGSEYTRTSAFRATCPTSVQLDIPIIPDLERLGFNVRKFASQWNLDGAKGVHMWREVWDDDVSLIYRDILGMEEPIFGRPPKVDAYAVVKQQKKYIS